MIEASENDIVVSAYIKWLQRPNSINRNATELRRGTRAPAQP